ncbi:MAG: hypothetical protein IJI45_08050 [Anaerolineaceae bacterium]|nr:hypothetical protein [Anaerolineaceae bacterium]
MVEYTIEDVLHQVFGEDFHTRLRKSIQLHPECLSKVKGFDTATRITLLQTTLRKMRSIWDQPIDATMVDVILAGKIGAVLATGKTVHRTLDFQIRYCFNLQLCSQTVGVIFMGLEKYAQRDALSDPNKIRLDSHMYAITTTENNELIAERMLEEFYPEALTNHVRVDGYLLAERMGIKIKIDDIELGAYAKLFVNYMKLQARDGRILDLKPGSIVIDGTTCSSFDIENQAIVHECIHMYRDRKHFLLQMLARNISAEQKGKENAA